MTDETETGEETVEVSKVFLSDVIAGLEDAIGELDNLLGREKVTVLVPAGRGFTLTVFGRTEPQVPLGELYDGF